MQLKIFSIFDTKLASFDRPFYAMTDAAAIRAFRDSVNDETKNNDWHRHPEDYSLYSLGSFDDTSGELVPDRPKSLVTASALVNEVMTPS